MPLLFPVGAAYALFVACILGILLLHGVPALLAGLLSYSLTRTLLHALRRRFTPTHALDWSSALTVGLGAVAVIVAIATEITHYLAGDSIAALMLTLADTLQHVRHYLPASLADQMPDSLLQAKGIVAEALKAHAKTLASLGSSALQHLVWIVIGWLVGVLAAAQSAVAHEDRPPFSATWHQLWHALDDAFCRVSFAQAKIATLNASLTAVYVLGVLPLVGWKLPYAATLVLVTFVCGLIPIVGNLISNALLCTLALGVAFPAAVTSLAFLVVIHKLEYVISARVQGHQIGAKAWEMLLVLFAAEALFGPAGMVAAPILYAFSTTQLRQIGWLTNANNSH